MGVAGYGKQPTGLAKEVRVRNPAEKTMPHRRVVFDQAHPPPALIGIKKQGGGTVPLPKAEPTLANSH
jgi:hypothetical protein